MEEDLILNIQVDQTDAQKQLVATEKSILSLKEQQRELNKEYKAGKISEDEYVKSNLAIQQAVKKEQDQKRTLVKLLDTEINSRNAARLRVAALTKEYNNLNTASEDGRKKADALGKELEQLNATLNKGSKAAGSFKDNIGNYPNVIENATKATVPFGSSVAKATDEIKPFGVSVGGATSSMAKFITPAGAALGILTGLVSVYAASATGARDLEFAQNQLSAATGIVVDAFGELLSINDGQEGQGIFSVLVGGLLNQISPALAGLSAIRASQQELLKQLQISEAFAKGFAKESERRAENARRIRDDESKSLDERLAQVETIDSVLSASAQRTVTVLQAQVEAIKNSTRSYETNRPALLEVAQIEGEIKDKEEEINGKLTENVRARQAILKLIKEQRDLDAAVARADARTGTGPGVISFDTKSDPKKGETPEELVAAQDTQRLITEATVTEGELRVRANERINSDILKFNKRAYADDLAAKKRNAALKQQVDDAQLAAASTIAGAAASLFDQQSSEYKIFATAQTLISTYAAAQKAYEAAFDPPTIVSPALGAAYLASAIATGLANVAAINGIQFAEGGYTGRGNKYEVAGTVHKGEYVTPKNVVESTQAKPHLAALESMRTRGYADGGFVANENISVSQLAMITANAIRNMPQPIVGVKQIVREMNAVQVKQNSSKI